MLCRSARRAGLASIVAAGVAASATTARATTSLGTVMALGDSITYGTDPDDASGNDPGGYRAEFYSKLVGAGYTFQYVGSETDNPSSALPAGETAQEGHPGATIGRPGFAPGSTTYPPGALPDSLPSLYNNLTAATQKTVMTNATANGADPSKYVSGSPYINANVQPNNVLLMAGTNNVLQNYGNNSVFGTAAEMSSLLTALYTALPNTHVYLATLIPFAATSTNTDPTSSSYFHFAVGNGSSGIAAANQQVQDFNSQLPALVAQFSSENYAITMVNTYGQFVLSGSGNSADYSSDGIHPDDAGYNLLGDTFAASVISSATPEPTPFALLAVASGGLIAVRRNRRVLT